MGRWCILLSAWHTVWEIVKWYLAKISIKDQVQIKVASLTPDTT